VALFMLRQDKDNKTMAAITLSKWNLQLGTGKPLFVIAGLNVLENIDLALTVGRQLKDVTGQLGLPYVFKASFDKANRSSIKSYRGPGLKDGLSMLAEIKKTLNVPIATDLHEIDQAEPVAAVADIVQIPAFLCRQTDLVTAAARATEANGGWLHVKKAQFLAPWDCKNIITKVREAAPNLDLQLDPKLAWALRNRARFPVDVNRAPREALLRVPGLGVRNVERILSARRYARLRLADHPLLHQEGLGVRDR
jgi:hypothetical protein